MLEDTYLFDLTLYCICVTLVGMEKMQEAQGEIINDL